CTVLAVLSHSIHTDSPHKLYAAVLFVYRSSTQNHAFHVKYLYVGNICSYEILLYLLNVQIKCHPQNLDGLVAGEEFLGQATWMRTEVQDTTSVPCPPNASMGLSCFR